MRKSLTHPIYTRAGLAVIFLDFEYYATREENLRLVCCTTLLCAPDREPETRDWWLHGDSHAQALLRDYLTSLSAKQTVFASYAVTAEGRAVRSLGLDPLTIRWVDLLVEWKQLRNHCHRYQYGLVQFAGGWRQSIPPVDGTTETVSNAETGTSIVDACMNLLSVNIDSAHKNQMRDRIIAGGPFTETEARAIMDYCRGDVVYLPQLLHTMVDAELSLLPEQAKPRLISAQLLRGRFSADMAVCEARGIPLHLPRLEALSFNHDKIQEKIIEEANAVYPFWTMERKGYVQKYDSFWKLLRERGWDSFWPLTESGRFSTEEKVLDNFRGYPEIEALRGAKKTLQQIKWFRPDALPEFYSKVGSDGRLRPYLNPFGTQTGRNAPPAKTFVLAMSAWLRCLVAPYEGMAITGRDWSSQEFAIAAVLSGDENMIAAYASGDPYLHFAKLAGSIPPDGKREQYERERDLAKGTALMLQFGGGYRKLAQKLTADTRKEVSEIEAKTLIRHHQNAFPEYWAWLVQVENKYARKEPICTRDGWYLWTDNPRPLSVKNFPVQGNGAAVMRTAIRLAHDKGLRILCPLHDAIYIEHTEAETEDATVALAECMDEAVSKILGNSLVIRGDAKTLTSRDVWVEKKGKAMYESLKQYVEDDLLMLSTKEEKAPVSTKRRKGNG